ncbi:hypothetical protein A1O7_06033 [Cladophialophora yegresii CBS 114405]|uniref:Phenazine biosynthesis protein n=1 Tax=Cladophialophora yegresii CBS 114405 TaxID=1182544 RepID=W9W267_9EURO|nr:uncharacterized protein A1O7_06033 [Cladophialophora yegresii CBS 114405]EXJ58606.1 hypothetical protein A1O7_06033 [Cladophialophora yegresii CBS 114405]
MSFRSQAMIDTMTEEAFKGNPTPVFVLDGRHQGVDEAEFTEWPDDPVLQAVARELNQSETIFVRLDHPGKGDKCNGTRDSDPGKDASTRYLIRSFTPSKEEPFCGHGIVGAAYLLSCSAEGYPSGIPTMRFQTVGGIVVDAQVRPEGEEHTARINNVDRLDVDLRRDYGVARTMQLEIPAQPVDRWFTEDLDLRRRIATALGIESAQVLALGRNALMDLVIELGADVDFSAGNMEIDAVALMEASPPGTRSQIITSAGARYGVDFVKRVFAYGSEGTSVIEYQMLDAEMLSSTVAATANTMRAADQATGSTYCVLIPYWGAALQKSSMKVKQVSARTGGAEVTNSATGEGYVTLYGTGVKVMEGCTLVPGCARKK